MNLAAKAEQNGDGDGQGATRRRSGNRFYSPVLAGAEDENGPLNGKDSSEDSAASTPPLSWRTDTAGKVVKEYKDVPQTSTKPKDEKLFVY